MNFDGIQAILHHTYHAGTICSETPEADKFFYEVANRKIPIFLCGMDADMVYESTYVYEKYGMIVLPMASPVAMYMKLWLLLCSGYSAKEWMTKPIRAISPILVYDANFAYPQRSFTHILPIMSAAN